MSRKLSITLFMVLGLFISSCSQDQPTDPALESTDIVMEDGQDLDPVVLQEVNAEFYRTYERPASKPVSPRVTTKDRTQVTVEIADPVDGYVTEDECITVVGNASAVGGASIDLHLILDTSESLTWNDPSDFREQAAVALMQSFNPAANLRVGAIDFDDDAFVASPLTSIGVDLGAGAIAAIQAMDQLGNTDIAEGIDVAVADFNANSLLDESRVSILFSDGDSDARHAIAAAQNAAAQVPPVVINTIFLGYDYQAGLLMQDIATATGGFFLETHDPQELIDLFISIPVTGIEEVTVNGVVATLAAGTFEADICLECGENEVEVIATATDGTQGCDIIFVTRTCEIEVPLDIKPTSCPNPFNMKSGGKLPIAIVGTMDLDVMMIDTATIMLEGVPALRWNYSDVATPYEPYMGRKGCMDCNELEGDGYVDLVLNFDRQNIVNVLGDVDDWDCVVLTMTGRLLDGTPIIGEDFIRIQGSREEVAKTRE